MSAGAISERMRHTLVGVNCPYVLDVDGTNIQGEGATLRAEGPVTADRNARRGAAAGRSPGYDTLRELLLDPRVSKDPRQHWPLWINDDLAEDWPLRIWVSVRNMFTSYGTEHRRLRSLVSSAFTARRTEALRPKIEAIATDLLDRIEDQAPNRIDLRAHFAYPAAGRGDLPAVRRAGRPTRAAAHGGGHRVRHHRDAGTAAGQRDRDVRTHGAPGRGQARRCPATT